MKIRTVSLALVLCISAACTTAAKLSKAPQPLSYDAFMQLDLDGRIRTFNEINAENRAQLVQTQIRRWVVKNRHRLTPEQLKLIDENLVIVTPDRYRLPRNTDDVAQAKELADRTSKVFSRDDVMQAFTIYALYIPKPN